MWSKDGSILATGRRPPTTNETPKYLNNKRPRFFHVWRIRVAVIMDSFRGVDGPCDDIEHLSSDTALWHSYHE